MPFEELKRRISLLQRGSLPARPSPAAADGRTGSCADLSRCFPEGAERATGRGPVFVCETSLSRIYSRAPRLLRHYLDVFAAAHRQVSSDTFPEPLGLLADVDPSRTAFVDTETAGFHGRPLFLIGLARFAGDDLLITQYFARTYAEEAGLLSLFARLLPEIDLLISFNGKAFDWPFMRDRMVYHRLDCQADFAHLDLLHPSRRRWRAHLPNCRLQTLERYLCGRWRSGDIPGADIPQRYHDFVRDRDARLIAPIFHHNRLDLIAMTELLVALADGRQPETSPPHRAAQVTGAEIPLPSAR